MYFCNCVAPLILFSRKGADESARALCVSILVLIGMWFERFQHHRPSLGHDFYPYPGASTIRPRPTTAIVLAVRLFFLLSWASQLIRRFSIVEVKKTNPAADAGGSHAH